MGRRSGPRRRFFVPEVVQTSAMDCGPASLKCLLEGFGVSVSYGRLREACQTDVDGTSIDTMEAVAVQLGLDAAQVMVPVDHVLLGESDLLPALAVVRRPSGLTHFVVVWRSHGRMVQVMDPALGRQWMSRSRLLDELYVHRMSIPAGAWLEWASSDGLILPLRRRLERLGVSNSEQDRSIDAARAGGQWQSLARLDAAVRLTEALAAAGALQRGRESAKVLELTLRRADQPDGDAAIPEAYWSARPAPPGADGEPQIQIAGAVLVHVTGKAPAPSHGESTQAPGTPAPAPLSPELTRALAEPPSRPGRKLLEILRQDGLLAPVVLAGALALAAAGVLAEALLFRGMLEMSRELGTAGQRLAAGAAMLVFLVALLALEVPVLTGLLRLGRHLETRLRAAFLAKIPRLGDRYFQSRLISDMAERSHALFNLRVLPNLAGQLLRAIFALVLTTAGIIWIDPGGAALAIAAAGFAVGIPLAMQPVLRERDLRLRNHTGALGRFYLDALQGLTAIRSHGAESAVSREHESLLVEWSRSALGLQRAAVAVEGLQALTGFGLAGWLLLDHLARGGQAGGVLLLVYWALSLPLLGRQIGLLMRQYPTHRSVTLRLLEPLGAKDEDDPEAVGAELAGSALSPGPSPAGVAEGFPPDNLESTRNGSLSRARERAGVEGSDGNPDPQPRRAASSAGSGLAAGPSPASAAEEFPPGTAPSQPGISVALRGVAVRAAGHTILEDLELDLAAGSHVAVVGPSGAGKSSLLGLLLGWHRPAAGALLIDGMPLAGAGLEDLRRQTAWVDPTVQLWNRSFLDNLTYGAASSTARPVSMVIEAAELRSLLEKLPEGLQTPLGEGGALVSGGEGQRVRLGRAMLRPDVRLVLLDEPFRGLDRERRRALLVRARSLWRGRTLLCVTHDVGETLGFERVLVIERGRLVDDGVPTELAAKPDSRYRALLDAEESVRRGLWSNPAWRRLHLEAGVLAPAGREEHP